MLKIKLYDGSWAEWGKIRTETIHFGVEPEVTLVQLVILYTKTQLCFSKLQIIFKCKKDKFNVFTMEELVPIQQEDLKNLFKLYNAKK